MTFQELTTTAQTYFPDLRIKYKDQSVFMKFLGTLMFFNKSFMTSYTTTIGSTIYFPNETFVKNRTLASSIILLHELVHIHDAHKIGKLLFGFLYLTPQILTLFTIPLFFISWKIALILLALFALPLPSFFRMYFERRAYFTSLYALYVLGQRLNFNPKLTSEANFFMQQFKCSYYYFMWPFPNLKAQFEEAVNKILLKQKPFEDPVFEVLDKLIEKV